MIELFDQQIKQLDRHSSKGNQLKWENDGFWYKADYTGYEGLAEYVVSQLLQYSSLKPDEFVRYEIEEIKYKNRFFIGAKSKSILQNGWQIITLERLFSVRFGESLYTSIWNIDNTKDRILFLCEQMKRITGRNDFGPYLVKLLTIDAFFLNEDRHTHNIAVLMNEMGEIQYCPIFDNGACLLADTKMDYPLGEDIYQLIDSVKAKTVDTDFVEQVSAVDALFGQQIKFSFTKEIVEKILDNALAYSTEERERVKRVIFEQMRKYSYLFS